MTTHQFQVGDRVRWILNPDTCARVEAWLPRPDINRCDILVETDNGVWVCASSKMLEPVPSTPNRAQRAAEEIADLAGLGKCDEDARRQIAAIISRHYEKLEALEQAAREFCDAPRQEHLVTRMSDREYAPCKRMFDILDAPEGDPPCLT